MVYRLEISDYIENRVDEIYEYLFSYVGIFGNPTAAFNFLREYEQVLNRIANSAESYKICDEEELAVLKIRKVHFPHLKYKLFYHVKDDTAIIDFILHDSQDYKKIL